MQAMRAKPAPCDVFRDNLADAEALLRLARAPEHGRRPGGVGEPGGWVRAALRGPFMRGPRAGAPGRNPRHAVAGPGGHAASGGSTDLQPLLRQSLVAACLALETYVVDNAMECLAAAAGAGEFPAGRDPAPGEPAGAACSPEGYRGKPRPVIDAYVQATRSIHPDRIGHILSSFAGPSGARHHMTAGPADLVDRAPAPPKPGPLLPPHRGSHRTHQRRPDRRATDARFHLGDGAHW